MILVSLFLAFLLPCLGMTSVILVYIFLAWCSSSRNDNNHQEIGSAGEKKNPNGLSDSELKKLPCGVACIEIKVREAECVVCLEDIEEGQLVRELPDCHHGFHLECADAWLSKNSACPICRHELHPSIPPDLPTQQQQQEEDDHDSSPENLV